MVSNLETSETAKDDPTSEARSLLRHPMFLWRHEFLP